MIFPNPLKKIESKKFRGNGDENFPRILYRKQTIVKTHTHTK